MKLNADEARRQSLALRAKLKDEAESFGVSEEFISEFVDHFYAKVRAEPSLGPIFSGRIGADWPHHLDKMKSFWRSVALRTGEYSGNPLPQHASLQNVNHGHFVTWLSLFEESLIDLKASPEARHLFVTRATSIASRFQEVMFARKP